jgi:transcriptional regulator with XRE-family HTH domain
VGGGFFTLEWQVDQALEVAAADTSGRRLGAIVRAARTAQGMTLAELGMRTGYSAGQVSRFERGIAPLTDIAVLRRFASVLELAPEILGLAPGHLTPKQQAALSGNGESVKPYADRGLVTRQQWNAIIRESASHLWLYGMAEFGYATDDAVPAILARATGRGCRVRILLLNPGSLITEAIDREERHPPGTLAARITAALARFAQMRRTCGTRVQIRVYDEYPTVSVVRGDDAMLVTPYMRFFDGSNSPTFEFRAHQAPKMFTRYSRHFENTWKLAKDWTA